MDDLKTSRIKMTSTSYWLSYLCTGVEEESGDLDVSVHRSLHERGVHLVRLVLLVGAGLQQEAHHLQVALVARQRQRRLLELVRVGVDASAVLEQGLKGKKNNLLK